VCIGEVGEGRCYGAEAGGMRDGVGSFSPDKLVSTMHVSSKGSLGIVWFERFILVVVSALTLLAMTVMRIAVSNRCRA